MLVELKNRTYKLEINDGVKLYSWDNIDLKFRITKTGSINPNECELTIYNLDKEKRNAVINKKSIITLSAGYESENGIIFKGSLETGEAVYNSPDWLINITSKDGIKQLKTLVKSISFTPKTEVKKIIDHIIKETGLTAGDLSGIPQKYYSKGFVLNGEAIKNLKDILANKKIDFFVNDGVINIVEKNKNLNTNAILLNESSGLIGTPKKTKDGYAVKSLLRPSLNPNSYIKVESKSYTGFLIVKNVILTGYTRSNEWYADLECIEKK